MSGRDEDPKTLPPPPGEADAYSARTRIGEMPPELMAELRAEPPDLLVLDTGALVPVVFVVGTPTDGVVQVDTPDGLFELGD